MTQPDFFEKLWVLQLTEPDQALLRRKADDLAESDGGQQGLIRLLAGRMTPGGHLEATDAELRKVERYIVKYGPGGFQDCLKGVRRAAWAAGWK